MHGMRRRGAMTRRASAPAGLSAPRRGREGVLDAYPAVVDRPTAPSRVTHLPGACCSTCHLRETCLPGGLAPDEVERLERLVSSGRRVAENRHLYRARDYGRHFFIVKTGSFKTLLVSNRTGLQKVTGFFLPGDILGLEVMQGEQYAHDAVALEDSVACLIPGSLTEDTSASAEKLSRSLLRVLSAQLSRSRNVLELLGALNAEQRVVAFLLNLGVRYASLGYDPLKFHLKMSREEMGSYVGLTMETVSRILSRLAADGLIRVERKKIEIREAERLRAELGF